MPAESVATWGARVAKTPDDNSLIRVLVIDDQPNVRVDPPKALAQ